MTKRSKWSLAMFATAFLLVGFGLIQAISGLAAGASILQYAFDALAAPVVFGALLGGFGAMLQYLFDIRAAVLDRAEGRTGPRETAE